MEEKQPTAYAHAPATLTRGIDLKSLDTVQPTCSQRYVSGISEWDRVTGGGIMPGAFMIVTGDPGIGKSTLLLHIAHALSVNHKVIYISSEESLEQVKLRAERIGCTSTKLQCADHANLDDIIATVLAEKPQLVIIDSIQNCHTSNLDMTPGSIGQIRDAAFKLMRLAKDHAIAIILSGHITKDGVMAGPKMLEHMVDTVLYLQGEDRWQTRILRAVKNRFGTVNELGFFHMQEEGLLELSNINRHLLEGATQSPGSVLSCYLEGSRPLLVEIQALAVPTKYGTPQRVVSGIEHTQVTLVIAILEKYLKVKLSAHDLFIKTSGGLKVRGSSIDLALALAILSSYFQQTVAANSLAFGELNLTGHIKPTNYGTLYIGEGEKFGIQTLYCSAKQRAQSSCTVQDFSHVYELVNVFAQREEQHQSFAAEL